MIGKKSIAIPLGEIKITRQVNALTIIFRSCTNVNMLTQNKNRLFEEKKSEYTFRSLNSIIRSIVHAKKNLNKVKFNIIVIDHNSNENDLSQIKKQLKKSGLSNSLVSLDVNEFKHEIQKVNAENKNVSQNQIEFQLNLYQHVIFHVSQFRFIFTQTKPHTHVQIQFFQ